MVRLLFDVQEPQKTICEHLQEGTTEKTKATILISSKTRQCPIRSVVKGNHSNLGKTRRQNTLFGVYETSLHLDS